MYIIQFFAESIHGLLSSQDGSCMLSTSTGKRKAKISQGVVVLDAKIMLFITIVLVILVPVSAVGMA